MLVFPISLTFFFSTRGLFRFTDFGFDCQVAVIFQFPGQAQPYSSEAHLLSVWGNSLFLDLLYWAYLKVRLELKFGSAGWRLRTRFPLFSWMFIEYLPTIVPFLCWVLWSVIKFIFLACRYQSLLAFFPWVPFSTFQELRVVLGFTSVYWPILVWYLRAQPQVGWYLPANFFLASNSESFQVNFAFMRELI